VTRQGLRDKGTKGLSERRSSVICPSVPQSLSPSVPSSRACFNCVIPLSFVPENSELGNLPGPTGLTDLKTLAIARLMLDNIAHIKAFWIATGVETAQLALWFGADDLDGTVQEEHIYHMAGSRTPEGMTTRAIRRLIRAAGREPIERDTLYNVVTGPGVEFDNVPSILPRGVPSPSPQPVS